MRANPARYMLNYAGVDYNEVAYPLDGTSKWSADKQSFFKDSYKFPQCPYIIDQAPLYHDCVVKINETFTIQ